MELFLININWYIKYNRQNIMWVDFVISKKNYTLIISYITTFICGVTSIISNYTRNLVGQIVYALIFGSTIGKT